MITKNNVALPRVVSRDEWRVAREELLAKEKQITRQLDELNALRRRLPMVRIVKDYVFDGPKGRARLLDFFDGRQQLIVYHFMFDPKWEEGCVGCSMFADQLSHPAHLNARGTSLVMISRAPLNKIEKYKSRMGWNVPWYSSFESDFNQDFGVTKESGESHGLSVFLRDGDNIYHTYFIGQRGVEHLGSVWTLLDLTPYGRQEEWENSPESWPKTPPYTWWRRHDQY